MTVIYWPTKIAEEELDYTLDWSHVLDEDDEIIVSSTWYLPTDTTSLIRTNTYFDHYETTIWLAGGDATESPYLIRNVIVTDVDSTYSQDVYLPIYYVLSNVCDVTGIIMMPDGQPSLDTELSFTGGPTPNSISHMGITGCSLKAWTDADGFFSTKLVCGSTYRVFIQQLGIFSAFTVPDTTSADLFELIYL